MRLTVYPRDTDMCFIKMHTQFLTICSIVFLFRIIQRLQCWSWLRVILTCRNSDYIWSRQETVMKSYSLHQHSRSLGKLSEEWFYWRPGTWTDQMIQRIAMTKVICSITSNKCTVVITNGKQKYSFRANLCRLKIVSSFHVL